MLNSQEKLLSGLAAGGQMGHPISNSFSNGTIACIRQLNHAPVVDQIDFTMDRNVKSEIRGLGIP